MLPHDHLCWVLFAAMILERIVGRDITKPIGKTDFHDVHYLRQMLFCTFKAMHQAQRKLAFHHADLRLANIMELLPETDRSHGHTDAPTRTPPSRSGKLQDASVHDMQHASGVLSAADSRATNIQEAATSNQPHPLSAGQSDLLEAPANASQDPVLQHSVEAHDLAGYTSGEKQLNFKASLCKAQCTMASLFCLAVSPLIGKLLALDPLLTSLTSVLAIVDARNQQSCLLYQALLFADH